VPFELRLLNGMNPRVPEVTVLIHKITKDRRAGEYRLHVKKVQRESWRLRSTFGPKVSTDCFDISKQSIAREFEAGK
jgi:hypothetical protein